MSAPKLPSNSWGASPTGYAWVVLFVVFLASVAAPLNQFKVPPMMPLLMESFGLDLGTAGLLMSVLAVTGFILALPAGFILQRLGPKAAGLIATGCMAIGAVVGAFSPRTGLLLTGRVIEGIGMGLIAVAAPVVVGMWFPAERRGIPMGIWATWMPVGRIIIYNVAPALGAAIGWQAVWWFGAAFALIALVLYWTLLRVPPAGTGTEAGEGQPVSGRAMTNRHIWLLGLQFCCFNIVFLAFGTLLIPICLLGLVAGWLVQVR